MRSYWIRMGLNAIAGVLIRRGNSGYKDTKTMPCEDTEHTDKQGKCSVMTEAESGMMGLHTSEHQGLPATNRN